MLLCVLRLFVDDSNDLVWVMCWLLDLDFMLKIQSCFDMTPKSNKSINFEVFLLISSLPFLFSSFSFQFQYFSSIHVLNTDLSLYLSLSYCQLLWNVLDSNLSDVLLIFLPFQSLLFMSRVGHVDVWHGRF